MRSRLLHGLQGEALARIRAIVADGCHRRPRTSRVFLLVSCAAQMQRAHRKSSAVMKWVVLVAAIVVVLYFVRTRRNRK